MAFVACGDSSTPAPRPEAQRTPLPPKALPVDEAAARLHEALSECLGREGFTPVDMGGRAEILRAVGARSPGAIMVTTPLHVVFTPAEARAVARGARHLRMTTRGRVVYEPKELGGARPDVEACVDEAERAAPVAE